MFFFFFFLEVFFAITTMLSNGFVLTNLNDWHDILLLLIGRAGRYGSKFPVGEVTCMDAEDLPLLHSSLNCPSPTLEVNMLGLNGVLAENAFEFYNANFQILGCNNVSIHVFLVSESLRLLQYRVLDYFLPLTSCLCIHDYTHKVASIRYWYVIIWLFLCSLGLKLIWLLIV